MHPCFVLRGVVAGLGTLGPRVRKLIFCRPTFIEPCATSGATVCFGGILERATLGARLCCGQPCHDRICVGRIRENVGDAVFGLHWLKFEKRVHCKQNENNPARN